MPFLRAGYNKRHRSTGIWARSRFRWVRLVRWPRRGDLVDLAWQGPDFLAWASTCHFHCLVNCGLNWIERGALPRSELPA